VPHSGVALVVAGFTLCIVLPGAAAARWVLGARRPFDLLWQTVLASVLVFTPLTYPAALLAGAPTLAAVAVPSALFAAACFAFGRGKSPLPWLRAPPSAGLVAAALLWAAACAEAGVLLTSWRCDGDTDVAYFFGMMRELGAATPAANPELASSLLTHSSGYWFWYACLQKFSGLDTQATLWLVGPLLAITVLAVLHRVSHFLWKDDRAALASVLLLLLPTESAWLPRDTPLLASGGARPLESFARSLVIAWYDGPALILMLLVLGCVTWLARAPAARLPLGVAGALLVLFPFHHAMYFGLTLCGLLPYVVYAVLTRRLRPTALLLFASVLPWRALAWAWPRAMLGGDPRFTLDLTTALPDLGTTLLRHAFVLPLALMGLYATRGRGGLALASTLCVTLLPGPWAGEWNRHWQWDPLALLLALYGGAGVSAIVERRHALGVAAAVSWALPNVASLGREGLFHTVLTAQAAPGRGCVGPPELVQAATWLASHTPSGARIATPPASPTSLTSLEGQYVEVYGGRRLVFGDALHLDMVDTPDKWRPIEADMRRLFQAGTLPEASALLSRHAVDYVVLGCEKAGECPPPGGLAALPVVFRSGRFVVLSARLAP
jgi:hypothetical protein